MKEKIHDIRDLNGKFLNIRLNNKTVTVVVESYIKVKTRQLQDFGFPECTEEMVAEQIVAILNQTELNVMGYFMEKEILHVADD